MFQQAPSASASTVIASSRSPPSVSDYIGRPSSDNKTGLDKHQHAVQHQFALGRLPPPNATQATVVDAKCIGDAQRRAQHQPCQAATATPPVRHEPGSSRPHPRSDPWPQPRPRPLPTGAWCRRSQLHQSSRTTITANYASSAIAQPAPAGPPGHLITIPSTDLLSTHSTTDTPCAVSSAASPLSLKSSYRAATERSPGAHTVRVRLLRASLY